MTEKIESQQQLYYWIAINGPSCAASPIPFPGSIRVSPRPHILIGFKTRQDAASAQRLVLTSRIGRIRKFLAKCRVRNDVVYRKLDSPEKPTKDQTMWMACSVTKNLDEIASRLADVRIKLAEANQKPNCVLPEGQHRRKRTGGSPL